ncbi:MAG: acylneuraminate cytidylyltransferase family protein [Desulfohalobiaceae bacterium]|nr:acylneuraminate cytidylyltransferase family protein [Desulfohalobiaceae bacterium]
MKNRETTLNVLGIVPARGGSKRIPNKNIHPLGGRPLIHYCLETAQQCPSLDRLVVSTESEAIAQTVAREGVEVIERPTELARDHTPTLPVIVQAIEELDKRGFQADIILTIQPTYPFLTVDNVEQSIEAIKKQGGIDSVTTVTRPPFHYHPFNARTINPDGTISFMFEEEKKKSPNTQSAPEVYFFGNLYTSWRRTIFEQGSLYGGRSWPIPVSRIEAMDIDEYLDLEIAEYIQKRINRKDSQQEVKKT